MKTSLVTGGAGFIGSHVVDTLIAMQHRVVVLDDLSGGFRECVHPSAHFVAGSIVNHQMVDALFHAYRFDYVFHLAAYAAEGLSHFIKRFNYTNNLIGSVNLINAAVNTGTVQCFVFTSSIAVYGANQSPMTEDMIPMPEDPYGIAKYAVEQDLHESAAMFGLPFIIFRPHNVYGERQNIGDRYRNVLGIFMNQAMQNKPFPIFGDGTQTRAFSHIDDVAPIIAHAIERPAAYNQIYNIGTDTPYTVNELAEVVAAAMGVELQITYLEARQEVLHAFSAHEKAQATFGDLLQHVSLQEGVQRMATWAKQQGVRATKPFTAIEVSKNMPSSWLQ
jgi:UDP-glucose 4-epimerase